MNEFIHSYAIWEGKNILGWMDIFSQHKFQLVKTLWSLQNLDSFRVFVWQLSQETNNCLVGSTFFSISCHRKQHRGGITHTLIKICQMTQTLTLPITHHYFLLSIRCLRKEDFASHSSCVLPTWAVEPLEESTDISN